LRDARRSCEYFETITPQDTAGEDHQHRHDRLERAAWRCGRE
jgi:hypothetical protein